jgi:hypothetical protein
LLSVCTSLAQKSPAPPLKVGEKSEILFAVEDPSSEKDEKGKPALTSLEPIAFLVGDHLRECYNSDPANSEDATSKFVLDKLKRAYAPGHRYPVWRSGALWGEAEAVHSCIDEDLDLTGCFRLHPKGADKTIPRSLTGIAFTGKMPAASHPLLHTKASPQERTLFIQSVVAFYAEQHIHASPQRIRADDIWKIQLSADNTALTGSALIQIPASKPRTYHSYRLFMAIEEKDGQYSPILTHFHKTLITLDGADNTPKPGEELDEESDTDKEVFFDNFPLFANEPDVIITRHSYYEDWNYSIYRRQGKEYQLIYTGCGGGD